MLGNGLALERHSSEGVQQLLYGDGRQVGVKVSLIVSAPKHQQSFPAAFPLFLETMETARFHGDDGVSRSGNRQLRERRFRPAVGLWNTDVDMPAGHFCCCAFWLL